MNNIVKTIKMLCQINSHNKVWIGELYDDKTVVTRWGKVGAQLQSKEFPDAGEEFLMKKQNEKLKKGYRILPEDFEDDDC